MTYITSCIIIIVILLYIRVSNASLEQLSFNNTSIADSFFFYLSDYCRKIFIEEDMNNIVTPCIESLRNENILTLPFLYYSLESILGYSAVNECSKTHINDNNHNSFLLLYSINITRERLNSNDTEWKILSFTHQAKKIFTRICLTDQCVKVIPVLQKSKDFIQFLNDTGINLTIYDVSDFSNEVIPNTPSYRIFIYFSLSLISFMLISSIVLRAYTYIIQRKFNKTGIQRTSKSSEELEQDDNMNKEQDSNVDKEQLKKNIEKEKEEFFNTSYETSRQEDTKQNYNYEMILQHQTNDNDNSIFDISVNQANTSLPKLILLRLLTLLQVFSIRHNYDLLSKPSTIIFNESSLEFISILRTICVCMITFTYTFYTLHKVMKKNFLDTELYTKWHFGFIKASAYGADFAIVIDSFVMSYKLMWYLKDNCYNKQQAITFKACMSFSIFSIPKIVTFIYEYFFILYSSRIAYEINVTPYRLLYHIKTSVGKKYCESHPWLIFIPFYLQYKAYCKKNDYTFNPCFRYTLIYQNELICCIIFLFLIYIMNKLRSKLFDYCIGGIIVLGIGLMFLNYSELPDKDFNFYFFLGQSFTWRYTHMFFPIYMLGAFAGVIYFYHKDSISSKPIALGNEGKYTPFDFCFKLMKAINALSSLSKYLIVILCILVYISFSLVYLFYREWCLYTNSSLDHNTLSIELNGFIKFIYYYDRPIIVIFFLVFVLLIFNKPKNSFINYLGQFRIMTVISRISFSALFIADSVVYLLLIAYDPDCLLDYPTTFVLTIEMLFFNTIICSILTICIEMPVRVIVKHIMQSGDKDITSSISSMTPIKLH